MKGDERGADGEHVAVVQFHRVNAPVVDVGAVGAAEVDDPALVALDADHGMLPGDPVVGEDQIVRAGAPDRAALLDLDGLARSQFEPRLCFRSHVASHCQMGLTPHYTEGRLVKASLTRA